MYVSVCDIRGEDSICVCGEIIQIGSPSPSTFTIDTTLMCLLACLSAYRLVKVYGPEGENGIPSYKDPAWIKAVKEANKAKTMNKEERGSLIVQMVPSDEEEEEDVVAMETDEDKDDDDGEKKIMLM